MRKPPHLPFRTAGKSDQSGSSPVYRSGFSLVEILIVIAVIGLLVTMVTLSIGSLGQSRKLTNAGNLAVDLINNARQLARAKNTMTMLAVVKSGDEGGRVFTTLEYAPESDAWSRVGPWSVFPEGIAIDQDKSAMFFDSASYTNAPTLKRNGESLVPADYAYAVFLPAGRPFNATAGPLVLQVGNDPPSRATNNFYKIIINQSTGIPSIRRP